MKVKDQNKELDEQATLNKLRRNQIIVRFCTNDLQEKRQFSGKTILLMSNFSFLLKSTLMQIIIMAQCRFPITGILSLMILEGGYTILNLVHYSKNKHLKSFLLLLPKLLSSILIFSVEFCLLLGYLKLEDKKFALTQSSQNTVINLAIISSYIEYALLGVVIIVASAIIFRESQRSKVDMKFKEYLRAKYSFLVYRSAQKIKDGLEHPKITSDPSLQSSNQKSRKASPDLQDEGISEINYLHREPDENRPSQRRIIFKDSSTEIPFQEAQGRGKSSKSSKEQEDKMRHEVKQNFDLAVKKGRRQLNEVGPKKLVQNPDMVRPKYY